MTVAIITALAAEMRPLARKVAPFERCRIGGVEAQRGVLAGRDVCLVAGGVGRRRARATLEPLLSDPSIVALVGIGVAGGLTDDLGPGDVVLGRRVLDPEGVGLEPPEWEWSAAAARLAAAAGGTVATVNGIVQTSAEKRRLAERLGLGSRAVVDLESAAWASAAASRGLPWQILRSVSDAVDERLPLDFERFRGAEGEISSGRILRHALVRPRLLLDLIRLRGRVASCAEALAGATQELVAC